MEIPEIWFLLGNHLHQDFMVDYPDFISGLMFIIQDFSPNQNIALHNFLLSLKEMSLSNQQLAEIWAKSGSQILIGDQNTQAIYDELLKAVELQLKKQT
jgi:hypothetical protein